MITGDGKNGPGAGKVLTQIAKWGGVALIGGLISFSITGGQYKEKVDANEKRVILNEARVEAQGLQLGQLREFVAAQAEINRNMENLIEKLDRSLDRHIQKGD